MEECAQICGGDAATACGHGDTAVGEMVVACSEQQTEGGDVNQGYNQEASSVPY
jgi:hypothetical protein